MSEIANIVTSASLLVTAAGGLIIALKKSKAGDGEAKAISVTKINQTDEKVEILIKQVDLLFGEITKLRTQKDALVKEVARLRDELKREKSDHSETKRLLRNALAELKDKNARLLVLENKKLAGGEA